jgi:hypothetical protein
MGVWPVARRRAVSIDQISDGRGSRKRERGENGAAKTHERGILRNTEIRAGIAGAVAARAAPRVPATD